MYSLHQTDGTTGARVNNTAQAQVLLVEVGFLAESTLPPAASVPECAYTSIKREVFGPSFA